MGRSRTDENAIPIPLPRIKRFEDMAFGLFVHWGLYSQLGMGEWAEHIQHIPRKKYESLIKTFTAKDFNAEDLAKTAKEAGMRYIVLTTRHHDGFSLYDTCGLNSFDAPHSPAKRDLIAEYVAACRKYDIVPFFYHTTLDWHWENKTTFDLTEKDFSRYLDYLYKSVELLCTKYGPIGGLWFDGNWSRPNSDWQEDRLYKMIHRYQPEAMVINNTGLGALGKMGHPEIDSVTYENHDAKPMDRRGHKKYVATEACMTMNAHWGLGKNDFNLRSPATVIQKLAACRGCGANLLLNIGPTAQGGIPDYERAVLKTVGKWHDMYEPALHKPRPVADCKCLPGDYLLKDGKTYYYLVSDLSISGDENVTVASKGAGLRGIEGFKDKVVSAQWMDNGEEISFMQDLKKELLALKCTYYPYGTNTVVRVMKIKTA